MPHLLEGLDAAPDGTTALPTQSGLNRSTTSVPCRPQGTDVVCRTSAVGRYDGPGHRAMRPRRTGRRGRLVLILRVALELGSSE